MFKMTIHKLILFLSSYIPLYFLLIVKDVVFRIELYGIKELKKFYIINSINDIAIVILFLLSLFSFIYLFKMIKGVKGSNYIKVHEVKDETSTNFLNYISTYLLSCMGLSIGNFTDIITLVFLMGIIGFIYVRSNMIYINPIINMLGYNIYNFKGVSKGTDEDIETILIAKRTFHVKKGDLLYTTNNTSFIFAIKKVNNK